MTQPSEQPAAREQIKALTQAFLDGHLPQDAEGPIHRVCERFALIAAGGELASRDGVTGWPEQAAYRAAAMRWQAWWTQQQATEMSTHAQILTQVRRFFEQKEARRFADWAADSPKMEHAAGFRHAENGQCLYYVHETLKAIYNRHSESDFDSELEEGKEVIKEMMQAMLGVELEGEIDLRAPEQMFAQAGEKMQRKMVQEEQLQQEQQAKRQKSARTLAKEQRAKEAAQHISKSLQEVYRKLASSLHPDKELDLAERMRKTELMQQLNTAYEKKDLLHLLELQLTAE